MEGKDWPCKCGYNKWKTMKKKKMWKCRNQRCGMLRVIAGYAPNQKLKTEKFDVVSA